MKTDRELLELAARAVGVTGLMYSEELEAMAVFIPPTKVFLRGYWDEDSRWNPLTEDGDSLRLVAHLEIGIQLSEDSKSVTAWWNQGTLGMKQDYSEIGLIAGIRRAVVRAAAAIGESME